ncbi:uncharacterized protein N7484_005174 [Penicillium longicatenatum]|uniref:uncharacterized protein n=1 Tax=Penicillium longicatenatum TaxID=1561947 RepID=UPI0025476C13|nr:uncharacterized protein N7484_005174 [Penicillium longicatenatum]KAJ5651451.1 hypothetical protein N7484_005174 [Penicillium longicatenatum]KAJ5670966.1 hypothetical protein N7507_000093 [Penicillium longicatenatum]
MFSDIKTALTKKRNKPRLLLALYARPKHPDAPHYALLLTPNLKLGTQKLGWNPEPIPATKYHVKNTIQKIKDVLCQPWIFEHVDVPDIDRDRNILVCTVIAKVLSTEHLEKVMLETHIYQKDDPIQFKARDFDCKMWCHDAYDELRKSGAIVGLDWRTAEGGTRAVLNQRHGEGRWASSITGECRNTPFVPIVDLLSGALIRG